jgi:hypothetical protein
MDEGVASQPLTGKRHEEHHRLADKSVPVIARPDLKLFTSNYRRIQ